MIAKLTGKVAGIFGSFVIVDVGSGGFSVGYEVFCKTGDVLSLKIGDLQTFYIKEIIKEDDDALYGFLSFEDRFWFEEFIKLSGLGAKIAMTILSTYSTDSIEEAILSNNCEFFSSISGIGSKLANRIPNEMKKSVEKIREKVVSFGCFDGENDNKKVQKPSKEIDKNTGLYVSNDGLKSDKKNKTASQQVDGDERLKVDNKSNQAKQNKNEIINDAVNALVALGFSRQSIYNDVYSIVKKNSDINTEDIVKEFLKKLDNC